VLRHLEAPDGVRIACEVSGDGPSLVCVHGAGSARWSFDAVRPHLEASFTVIAVDRRGRGDSSDGNGYELEREYEDIATVLRDSGDGVLLLGHSYGGLVAAGAARLFGRGLGRLVLYEPPMGGVLAASGTIDRWERMIHEGDRDLMMREFLNEVGGYDDAQIDELARSPLWEARKRVTPTVPRELRAERAHRLDPGELGQVSAPALLLVGTESPDWAVRSIEAYTKALPSPETRRLEGHGHSANVTAPDLLAAELERFLAI
jgi:pimeloyl-ACP methyl ester carboxylesterase